jgi:hypothetical protein
MSDPRKCFDFSSIDRDSLIAEGVSPTGADELLEFHAHLMEHRGTTVTLCRFCWLRHQAQARQAATDSPP